MRPLSALVVAALALAAPLPAQDRPLPDLQSFLAEARAHLHTDDELQSGYTFRERRTEVHISKLGKVTTGPVKVFDVYPGVGPIGPYRRLVSVDGKPRSEAELAADDRQRRQDVLEAIDKREHESPADREKRLERREERRRKQQDVLDDLLRVYRFAIVGRRTLDGRATIVLDFAPRPDARPRTDQGKLMEKARGRAWISEDDHEVARVEVEMIDDVPVGWGVLGKLYKGATASFERRKINGEVWLPRAVHFEGDGRALIRHFHVSSSVEFSDYRKFSVETSTTFSAPPKP